MANNHSFGTLAATDVANSLNTELHDIAHHIQAAGYNVNTQAIPTHQKGVAWYLHVLLGLGVTVAFLLFLLLLGVSNFFDLPHLVQAVFGCVFIGVAIALNASITTNATTPENIAQSLAFQVSILLMATGKGLVVFNVCEYYNFDAAYQLFLVASTVIALTFPWYRVTLERTLSVVAVVLLGSMSVLEVATTADVYGTLYFAGIVAALVLLSVSRWSHRYLRYTFVIVMVVYGASRHEIFYDVFNASFYLGLWYPQYVLVAGLVLFIALTQASWYRNARIMALVICALALAYVIPFTVFFAVLVMVLGYGTYDKVMIGVGGGLLPYYLFEYYYSLHMTLLEKSYLLAAGGLILLSVAAVITKLSVTSPKASS